MIAIQKKWKRKKGQRWKINSSEDSEVTFDRFSLYNTALLLTLFSDSLVRHVLTDIYNTTIFFEAESDL